MATFTEHDVQECACLHKQITEWLECSHSPSHIDLCDAVLRLLGSTDPIAPRTVRSACVGRRSHLRGNFPAFLYLCHDLCSKFDKH